MKRTIKDISRREMYAMAQEYAETDYLLSGNYFAERYEISTSTFYAVLHKAISESLVSIEIARKITQKAAYNFRSAYGPAYVYRDGTDDRHSRSAVFKRDDNGTHAHGFNRSGGYNACRYHSQLRLFHERVQKAFHA